jgi:hypothetical protein
MQRPQDIDGRIFVDLPADEGKSVSIDCAVAHANWTRRACSKTFPLLTAGIVFTIALVYEIWGRLATWLRRYGCSVTGLHKQPNLKKCFL